MLPVTRRVGMVMTLPLKVNPGSLNAMVMGSLASNLLIIVIVIRLQYSMIFP